MENVRFHITVKGIVVLNNKILYKKKIMLYKINSFNIIFLY